MRRKILTLVTGAMGGQALTFLALPLIARLYPPEQLGAFQVMLAFANTLGVVSALSFERTLLLDTRPARRDGLTGLSLLSVLMVSALSVPLYLVFAQIVSAAPVWVMGLPVALFAGAIVLLRGLFLVEYTAAIGHEQVRRASMAVFAKDVARLATRIGLGLSLLNPIGLFAAGAVDWATGTAMLWRRKAPLPPRRHLAALIARYRSYPLFYAPSVALTTLTAQMPVLLLGGLFTAREAGLYGMAFLLLDRPGRIVAKAAGDVLMHGMARADAQQAHRAVVRRALVMTLLTLTVLLGLAAITHVIAKPLLGPEWQAVGLLAFACVPHALALFVSDLSIGLFAAVRRSTAGLWRQIISALALMGAFGLAYGAGLPVTTTVLCAGMGHLLVQLGFLIGFYHSFRQRQTP